MRSRVKQYCSQGIFLSCCFIGVSVGILGCGLLSGEGEVVVPGEPGFEKITGELPSGFLAIAKLSTEKRDELKARGSYLVQSAAACGLCHGAVSSRDVVNDGEEEDLSGGKRIVTPEGEVIAPNITPHFESGVGNWSILEIVRALRDSSGLEGRKLNPFVHQGFEWLSDNDAQAIAVYILSLPALESAKGEESGAGLDLGPFQIAAPELITGKTEDFRGYIPAITEGETFQYGQYLADHVARCQTCHSGRGGLFQHSLPYGGSDVSGGDSGIWKEIKTAALGGEGMSEQSTRDYKITYPKGGPDLRGKSEGGGLVDWLVDDIARYLERGSKGSNENGENSLCPVSYYKNLSLSDRRAIAIYLKGL